MPKLNDAALLLEAQPSQNITNERSCAQEIQALVKELSQRLQVHDLFYKRFQSNKKEGRTSYRSELNLYIDTVLQLRVYELRMQDLLRKSSNFSRKILEVTQQIQAVRADDLLFEQEGVKMERKTIDTQITQQTPKNTKKRARYLLTEISDNSRKLNLAKAVYKTMQSEIEKDDQALHSARQDYDQAIKALKRKIKESKNPSVQQMNLLKEKQEHRRALVNRVDRKKENLQELERETQGYEAVILGLERKLNNTDSNSSPYHNATRVEPRCSKRKKRSGQLRKYLAVLEQKQKEVQFKFDEILEMHDQKLLKSWFMQDLICKIPDFKKNHTVVAAYINSVTKYQDQMTKINDYLKLQSLSADKKSDLTTQLTEFLIERINTHQPYLTVYRLSRIEIDLPFIKMALLPSGSDKGCFFHSSRNTENLAELRRNIGLRLDLS